MKVTPTNLPEVLLIEPQLFSDARGSFMETYQASRYSDAGISETFVQDNVSRSDRGVLRGLHYQQPNYQGKLVSVLEGEVLDVAVDIRIGSPNFGKWISQCLSSENRYQLFIPQGFAHGFCVTSETALFMYKCSSPYDPQGEGIVLWNDPALGIEWPACDITVSEKDAKGSLLGDIDPNLLPRYHPQ